VSTRYVNHTTTIIVIIIIIIRNNSSGNYLLLDVFPLLRHRQFYLQIATHELKVLGVGLHYGVMLQQ